MLFSHQDSALWACLAGMATSARDLNTAEIAYAAIDKVGWRGTCAGVIIEHNYNYNYN